MATETTTQVYECHNKSCTLGSRTEPGRFTGGMTPEARNLLTGEPVEHMIEGKDFGEGICPNCGELGKKTGEKHESVIGDDPLQKLHDKIGARVADPDDELTAEDAQDELLIAVKKNG